MTTRRDRLEVFPARHHVKGLPLSRDGATTSSKEYRMDTAPINPSTAMTRADVLAAVAAARAKGERPDLSWADLYGANLSRSDKTRESKTGA